jgi:hypothetical protein
MVHFLQAVSESKRLVIHRAIYALAFSAMFLGIYHEAVGQSRGIRSKITSITIVDEDDPLSNDEPYLILIRVRARLLGLATTSPRLDPASISVSLSMNGQNNLGRSSDNWADEPRSFAVPSTIPNSAQSLVPLGQSGWIVCGLLIHMEEDGFTKSTATQVGVDIKTAVQNKLIDMAQNNQTLTVDGVLKEVVGQLSANTLKKAMQNLISIVDPDDFGGMHLIGGVTLTNGTVWTYAGSPKPIFPLFNGANPLTVPGGMILTNNLPSRNFSVSFPGGLTTALPSNMKFQGQHTVKGKIEIFQQ